MGDSDWSKLINQLIEKGYRGDITIEGYHDPIYSGDREMEGQLLALDYLKKCKCQFSNE